MSGANELCQQVDEMLSEVLDGTAPAPLFEHIAECDECRDKKHDAQRAAAMVAEAALDFRSPEGFEDRLVNALAERPSAAVSGEVPLAARLDAAIASETAARLGPITERMETAPVDPMGKTVAMPVSSDPGAPETPALLQGLAPLAGAVAVGTTLPEAGRSLPSSPLGTPFSGSSQATTGHPVSQGAAVVAAAPNASGPRSVPARKGGVRRSRFFASAAVLAAAAAAFGFYLKGRPKAHDNAPDPRAPWAGTVASVSRAAADKTGGLEACAPKGGCTPVANGATIAAGTVLKTDARTRARVAFADGSEISLDRATELEMGAKEARAAMLKRGTVVADVAHLEGASAHLRFPGGDVEVVGTKLALTASDDRASVEVARGEVRISTGSAKPVSVRAGEEATIIHGGEPIVANSSSIADTMEWSDKSPEEVDAPVLRGLGELRARRPGETKEKDHAVRLAKHATKVRIVDLVARTEVDETFSNDTDQELEGIFRFPLPPGAQIERLALEVDGKLVDGAFVDRDRGAAIWRGVIHNAAPKAPKPKEEIIWVPGPWRDPALLEWQRGGRFELKIFPIPKRGSRRVVLAYTQTVDQAAGLRRFVLPLAHDASGTTKVDAFDLDVQVLGADKSVGLQTRGYELTSASAGGDGERRTMHADAFVPAGDLTVEYALPGRDKEVTTWAYAAPISSTAAVTVTTPGSASSAKAEGFHEGAARRGQRPIALEEQKNAEIAADALVNDPSPYVAISIKPKLPRWKESKERVQVIVVDASRSMFGERFARATRLASSIVREMDRRDQFVLLSCDTTCRAMGAQGDGRAASNTIAAGDTQAPSFTSTPGVTRTAGVTPTSGSAPGAAAAEEVERFLGQIEPDGGSDLAQAMREARGAATSGRELRVIYLGDGTPTVGPTKGAHLELATRQALSNGDSAVVAVALGADADMTSLEALARGGGGVVVPYVPGQRVGAAALDVLAASYGEVLRDPEIELPSGLTQVTPARLDPIRAGGETLVVARMTGSDVSGTLKLRGKVGGDRFEQSYPVKIVPSSGAGNAFVPRLFAAAKIAELEREGGDAAKPTAIALSTRFQVASRFTSLLVLESEAMFKAFGVDRGHGAVGGGGFTGEDAAESASADGDLALADDAAPDAPAEKDEKSAKTKSPAAPRRAAGATAGGGRGFGNAPGNPYAKNDLDGLSSRMSGDAEQERAHGPMGHAAPQSAAAPSAAPVTPAPPPAPPAEAKPSAEEARKEAPAKKAARPQLDRDKGGEDAWDQRQRETSLRRRGFVPMKKVFDRKTAFDAINTLASANAGKLLAAETAARATPDNRDKTVELFALYSTSNRLGEAQELTARWAGRDALDPEALLARADLAARQGDRARAIRVLGGLVDVRPNDRAAQVRLADLHDAAGDPARACEHRITIAELASTEVKPVADAVRCTRAQGMSELASRLELDAGEKLRPAIEAALATTPPVRGLVGDVQVSAEWSGGEDLDVSIIDAQGRRTSWMGTPLKNALVSARDVTSATRETLAVANLPSGSYVVEISRAAGGDVGAPVRGEVTLRLGNETRKVPFNLTAARTELGTVRVFFTSRLVPADTLRWR